METHLVNLRRPAQDVQVLAHRAQNLRSLDLHRDVGVGTGESRPVHLRQRSRRDGFLGYLVKEFPERPAEFLLDRRDGHGSFEGLDRVLEHGELV